MLAHANDIGGAVGENLRKVLDWLPQARTLLTIKCDVELPVKVEELAHTEADRAKLIELFERFEFKSWRRELNGGDGTPEQAQQPAAAAQESVAAPVRAEIAREYETILTEEALDAWLARIVEAPLTCVDTETTSLDPLQARLVGMSFSVEPGRAAYLPLAHAYAGAPAQLSLERTLEKLKPWLEDAARPKLGQNIKYDMHVFANYGVRLAGVVHDTLLESYVVESHKPHDMDTMAERHLGVKTIPYVDVCGKGASQICFDQVSIERATEYAAEDADITLQLHGVLHPQVDADAKLKHIYRDIEMPVMPVLHMMERNGVLLDTALLDAQSGELGAKMLELEGKAHELAGQPFNLNSPKQIQEILFGKLGIKPVKKTPSGTPSTDEDALAQLALDHPLPKLLLEYRGTAKLKSTYTDKLPRMVNPQTGRVHTNYAQAVAITGRLASNDPNLQNIPVRTAEGRRIREAFIAPPGSAIVSADYSQVELRIMAHLSGDEALLAAFDRGDDIHRATAAEVFGRPLDQVSNEERRYAKAINFGLMYGMSAFGLAQQLGIERATAAAYISSYFARFAGVAQFLETVKAAARERGYVESVFGRRVYLPEIASANPARRAGAERQAINAPMQGTAADLIKLAMVKVQQWLDEETLATRLVMQVHDELVLEVPEAELERVKERIPELMTGVAELRVPLVADLGAGPNWEKAH